MNIAGIALNGASVAAVVVAPCEEHGHPLGIAYGTLDTSTGVLGDLGDEPIPGYTLESFFRYLARTVGAEKVVMDLRAMSESGDLMIAARRAARAVGVPFEARYTTAEELLAAVDKWEAVAAEDGWTPLQTRAAAMALLAWPR